MTYMLLPFGASGVRREADGVQIPEDPSNADWRAYQAWLAAGNKPNPAPATTPAPALKPAPDARTVLAALGLTPAQIETAIARVGG